MVWRYDLALKDFWPCHRLSSSDLASIARSLNGSPGSLGCFMDVVTNVEWCPTHTMPHQSQVLHHHHNDHHYHHHHPKPENQRAQKYPSSTASRLLSNLPLAASRYTAPRTAGYPAPQPQASCDILWTLWNLWNRNVDNVDNVVCDSPMITYIWHEIWCASLATMCIRSRRLTVFWLPLRGRYVWWIIFRCLPHQHSAGTTFAISAIGHARNGACNGGSIWVTDVDAFYQLGFEC